MGKNRQKQSPTPTPEPRPNAEQPPVEQAGEKQPQFKQSPMKFMLIVWGIPVLILVIVLLKRTLG
ncbi:MAG TPA: hypothetical protein PK668_26660 [Myxococcota bacterium]|nr:hypothetical protein [Myxococcota bacterium]HRY97111.1 hypothetical protein [Myxococcota bacterium]HSA23171.1 hypothetical protein [Myxococcota bacterium]